MGGWVLDSYTQVHIALIFQVRICRAERTEPYCGHPTPSHSHRARRGENRRESRGHHRYSVRQRQAGGAV